MAVLDRETLLEEIVDLLVDEADEGLPELTDVEECELTEAEERLDVCVETVLAALVTDDPKCSLEALTDCVDVAGDDTDEDDGAGGLQGQDFQPLRGVAKQAKPAGLARSII